MDKLEEIKSSMSNLILDISSPGPKQRRVKDSNVVGVTDELGFFRTPNGSFWDADDEYFNSTLR